MSVKKPVKKLIAMFATVAASFAAPTISITKVRATAGRIIPTPRSSAIATRPWFLTSWDPGSASSNCSTQPEPKSSIRE